MCACVFLSSTLSSSVCVFRAAVFSSGGILSYPSSSEAAKLPPPTFSLPSCTRPPILLLAVIAPRSASARARGRRRAAAAGMPFPGALVFSSPLPHFHQTPFLSLVVPCHFLQDDSDRRFSVFINTSITTKTPTTAKTASRERERREREEQQSSSQQPLSIICLEPSFSLRENSRVNGIALPPFIAFCHAALVVFSSSPSLLLAVLLAFTRPPRAPRA